MIALERTRPQRQILESQLLSTVIEERSTLEHWGTAAAQRYSNSTAGIAGDVTMTEQEKGRALELFLVLLRRLREGHRAVTVRWFEMQQR